MTAFKQVGAPLTKHLNWKTINWKTVEAHVKKLQFRIAKAIKLGRHNKVKALQWLLTHSFYAKLSAIKRVTQNKGKNTPGVDGVIWKTANQKMQAVSMLKRRGYQSQPLRRIHIPKKNGKLRPLGIPTKIDLAQQVLHLLALEPIAEIQADKNSYGFRPKRSVHDAIQQCFNALARKSSPKWILEGDIKSCFDKICHNWIQKNVPMDQSILKQWLKSGYIEKDVFHQTTEGATQGGPASPVIANLALDGLEKVILAIAKPRDKVNFVRYADDWICTATTRNFLEEKVISTVNSFLKERGLELSQEKTKITHIDEGFDFLGFNLRKYKGKLLIKPGKKSIKTFLQKIREVIYSKRAHKAEVLIQILNPMIQGWANHYRHVVSKAIFSHVDNCIFKSMWKWAKRRHPNKGIAWIKKKYFTRVGQRDWLFFSEIRDFKSVRKIFLSLAADFRIIKHVKIRADATPYDRNFKEYFLDRKRKQQTIRKYSRTSLKRS